ncbi:hypothetical protein [Kitasatospora kifunensis]|uniref:Uncharacterized protein n=1 Tax=Kitasatospora kifunensis TaxID=58351 RepID=A0A7W7RA74_KITKI|nr:hypothetical protein [Kitasatospora kifunensis]MBB4928115.1 hypothetical protein [Kitasatospora kifunensis]
MTATTSTPRPPAAKVTWSAQWLCVSCRDGCDAYFDDGTVVDADHDCDQGEGEVSWEGRAECSACGWSLESDFADGDRVEADHDCHADQ